MMFNGSRWSQLRFPARVLKTLSRVYDDAPHDVLTGLKTPESPSERVNNAESIAEAVWTTLAEHGVVLPPIHEAYVLARPFDDGEVRLVVLSGSRVVYNTIWAMQRNIEALVAYVHDLERAIRAFATVVSTPASSGHGAAGIHSQEVNP